MRVGSGMAPEPAVAGGGMGSGMAPDPVVGGADDSPVCGNGMAPEPDETGGAAGGGGGSGAPTTELLAEGGAETAPVFV